MSATITFRGEKMKANNNTKNTDLRNIRFRRLHMSPEPVLQVDFARLESVRLRKGISLRDIHKRLTEEYNIFTARDYINDYFRGRRKPEVRASFYMSICDILDVKMDDYIIRTNHTESCPVIHNSHKGKKSDDLEPAMDTKHKNLNKKKECVF